jgi:hypothetical protein
MFFRNVSVFADKGRVLSGCVIGSVRVWIAIIGFDLIKGCLQWS